MTSQTYSRRTFVKAAGLSAFGLAVAGCSEPIHAPVTPVTQAKPKQPNILWITCEDTSPCLGCYGDPYAITPNLDRLAGDSVLYTHAFATAPVCAPSRSCLITGVYATSTGTQHLRSEVRLPAQVEPFPKRLRAAGYYCSNNYKEDYNFTDTGIWDDSSHAAHWRNRRPGQPFFSVFNIMATHQGQIDGSDEVFFETYRSKLSSAERHDEKALPLPPFYPDTPTVRKIWCRYYDLITYMDKEVGSLLAQLDADGLTDSTIVFFFSDHGLGLPRFKRTLYDSGLRVPLLVRLPRRYQRVGDPAPGTRTDRLVSFVDFAPTVLNLVGLPTLLDTMQGQPFLGAQQAAPHEYVFGASSRVDEVYEMSRSVRDKRYKYIHNFMPHLPYVQPSEYPDRAEIMKEFRRLVKTGALIGPQKALWEPTKPVEELYDTLTDPNEMKNLAAEPAHREALERLRNELRVWMLTTHDTGLLPEAEMHIRAEGSTAYEMAQDDNAYPIARVLAAAQLVGQGPQTIPLLKKYLLDPDSGVRYWATVALDALDSEAAPAAGELKQALADASPNVRFTAAGVLCRLGECGEALPILTRGLQDPRETVILHAARTLESIGDKARPALRQMELAREQCKNLDGSYRNDNHAMFIDWALKYAIENCRP